MRLTGPRRPSRRTEELAVESSVPVPPGLVAAGSRAAALLPAVVDAPLFANVPRDAAARAVRHFDEVHFPSGRRVVLEGLQGSDFFLIITGSAAVMVDGWRVASLGPGEFFGEMAILGGGLRTASVRAETPLHCLVLANGRLEELLLEHPQLGINMLRAVVGRYRGLNGHRAVPAMELTAG